MADCVRARLKSVPAFHSLCVTFYCILVAAETDRRCG